MVAPLVIIAGAALAGAAVSVISGYAIEKTVGDGNYSQRDFAIDAGMGVIPGAALAKPVAKIGWSLRHLRRFDRAQGDRIREIPGLYVAYNRKELTQLGMWGSANVALGSTYDYLFGTGRAQNGATVSHSVAASTGAKTFQEQISAFTPTRKPRSGKSSGGRCNFVDRASKSQCVLRRGHDGRHRIPNV